MNKITNEEFIRRAKEVHGDKYDYSKTKYVNTTTKVCIICPEHGEFWQTPSKHLIGRGCPKCGGSAQLTTEDFIRKAKEIHGNKYDYRKTEYVNANTKVCIICPKHGEFWMLPSNHTHKTRPQGCPKCKAESPNPKRLTTEDFIRRAKEVHGDKYDYSKVEYVDYRTKVCIICPIHGEFFQQPGNHLMGNGCPRCLGKGLTQEEFINEARKVHGDKYDYSKVEYKTKRDKICIICPKHGEFLQIAQSHLSGHGCPKCAIEKAGETQRLSKEEFIKKAREIHGDRYDYSKVEYVNSQTKVCIICPKHGEFLQVPNAHLGGCGCPKCVGKDVLNTDEFIRRAKEIHGDRYDYSKVEYVNSQTKVCIICPEHGEFWTTPNNHFRGKGCPKCVGKYKTTEDFIKMAKEVHGDKYDYSKTIFVNNATKVCVICPEHGEFWQNPYQHLNGNGCPKCAFEKASDRMRYSQEDFIKMAKEVHGDKYDYSKVEYVDSQTKVCIICPIHGELWQKPSSHLKGYGCAKCAGNSKLNTEEFIRKAKEIHGDRYDYSKVEYVNASTKVCIICPEHGEFWVKASHFLGGHGCPNCAGLRKQYKFNLLDEFESEYDCRAFLNKGDRNILYVILGCLKPKFDPMKRDLEKALANDAIDPMKALRDKYTSDSDDEVDEDKDSSEDFKMATAPTIDLDDDDTIDEMLSTEVSKEKDAPTIEDMIKYTEREIKVINKIEPMLTPEVRKYIVDKFTNDMLRLWMAKRENNKVKI